MAIIILYLVGVFCFLAFLGYLLDRKNKRKHQNSDSKTIYKDKNISITITTKEKK